MDSVDGKSGQGTGAMTYPYSLLSGVSSWEDLKAGDDSLTLGWDHWCLHSIWLIVLLFSGSQALADTFTRDLAESP